MDDEHWLYLFIRVVGIMLIVGFVGDCTGDIMTDTMP